MLKHTVSDLAAWTEPVGILTVASSVASAMVKLIDVDSELLFQDTWLGGLRGNEGHKCQREDNNHACHHNQLNVSNIYTNLSPSCNSSESVALPNAKQQAWSEIDTDSIHMVRVEGRLQQYAIFCTTFTLSKLA